MTVRVLTNVRWKIWKGLTEHSRTEWPQHTQDCLYLPWSRWEQRKKSLSKKLSLSWVLSSVMKSPAELKILSASTKLGGSSCKARYRFFRQPGRPAAFLVLQPGFLCESTYFTHHYWLFYWKIELHMSLPDVSSSFPQCNQRRSRTPEL